MHPGALPNHENCCQPSECGGPGGLTSSGLKHTLSSISAWTTPKTQHPSFAFRWSSVAAKTNLEILQSHYWDLQKALSAQPFSTLSTGSKFCHASIPTPLCWFHPLWSRASTWLSSGVKYPLQPINDLEWLADLKANLTHRDYQSAVYNEASLTDMLKEEVLHGWQLILPCDSVWLLCNAIITPLSLVEQDTINEHGKIIPKWHLIHDQSFNIIKVTHRSVNDCLITDDLTPCHYGKALLWHIHTIIGLRQWHPNLWILQSKVDWKSAYHQLHYAANTAIQSIILVGLRMGHWPVPVPPSTSPQGCHHAWRWLGPIGQGTLVGHSTTCQQQPKGRLLHWWYLQHLLRDWCGARLLHHPIYPTPIWQTTTTCWEFCYAMTSSPSRNCLLKWHRLNIRQFLDGLLTAKAFSSNCQRTSYLPGLVPLMRPLPQNAYNTPT